MKSFFSRFKDNLKMDFGGRYLEAILMEVLKEDLSILKILFPMIDTQLIKNRGNTLRLVLKESFLLKTRKNDLQTLL